MNARIAIFAAVSIIAGLSAAIPAAADTVPIQVAGGSLPWTDPNHQSPLEVFASQVASKVANRSVSVRCEGDNDWQTLATQAGFDPSFELGYVNALWRTLGGVQFGDPIISGFTEISPRVCRALQDFALAAPKPTKCSQLVSQTETKVVPQVVYVNRRTHVQVVVKGKKQSKWVTKKVAVTRQVPTQVQTQVAGPLAPCFANGAMLPMSDPNYWPTYRTYAYALLTLAHESIHLGGAVGGQLRSGALVGDQQAEAHANCYGLQWMPNVASQFGATPEDALAIAQYAYTVLYPTYQGTSYWSADCVPGGAMDIRTDKSASSAWP